MMILVLSDLFSKTHWILMMEWLSSHRLIAHFISFKFIWFLLHCTYLILILSGFFRGFDSSCDTNSKFAHYFKSESEYLHLFECHQWFDHFDKFLWFSFSLEDCGPLLRSVPFFCFLLKVVSRSIKWSTPRILYQYVIFIKTTCIDSSTKISFILNSTLC